MADWTTALQPFGQNRSPALSALASDGSQVIPVAVDKTTGRLLVNATGSSGGTSSTFGASFPTTGTAVGASDGTNMQPLLVDASGYLEVNVKSGGGGGTQYQELATTTPATGTLALGRYQTTFPTLTNGQMNEPMLDSSSRLLVSTPSNQSMNLAQVNGNTTSTAGAGTQLVGVADGSGNLISSTGGALNVSVAGSTAGSPPASINNAQVAGNDITTTAPGTQLVSLAGELGDPLSTTGNTLNVNLLNPPTTVAASQVGVWSVKQSTTPWMTTLTSMGGVSAAVSTAGAVQVDTVGKIQAINNQQIAGTDQMLVSEGIGLTALAGSTGDPVDTTGSSLNVAHPYGSPIAASANQGLGALTWFSGANPSTAAAAQGNVGTSILSPVKVGPGNIYGWHIYNINTTNVYLYFWDVASSSSLVFGSSTQSVPTFMIVIPPSGWVDDPSLATPIAFQRGLVVAANSAYLDGTTLLPAIPLYVTIWYR